MQQLRQPSYRRQRRKLPRMQPLLILLPLLLLLLLLLLLGCCQAQQRQAWQAALRAASCPSGCWWAGWASCMPLCCWLHTSSASPQQAALLQLLELTCRIQSRQHKLRRQAATLLLHCCLCFSCESSLQQQWQQVLCRQAAAQPSLLNSS
jgi:hypothetical protein